MVWSSRESMAAQLVSLLRNPSREPNDFRRRVRCISLLGVFGGDEQLSLLRELILNPQEPYHVRVNALRVASRFGLSLTSHEFVQLSEERIQGEEPDLSMRMLFDSARLESFDDVITAALLRQAPDMRGHLLWVPCRTPQPPELGAWLFERWHQVDHHLMAKQEAGSTTREMKSLRVACAQRNRPEAWQVLCEWVEGASEARVEDWLESLQGEDCEWVARLAASVPSLRPVAAKCLQLALHELLAHWGEQALLHRLDRIVRAAHVAHMVARRLVAPPRFLSRAMELLGAWDVARRRVLYRRLCDLDMALEVRLDLFEQLRENDPAAATKWALVAFRYPENGELLRRILASVMFRQPRPEDRPVLQMALRETDAEMQRLALSALLALGDNGPGWEDRLQSLSHAESPDLRVLALAGLVQSGQRAELEPLRRLTQAGHDWRVRDTALHWLGMLDAEDSHSLFLDCLAEVVLEIDGAVPRSKDGPIPAGASSALSRRGTNEDLSLLLNLRLGGYICDSLDNHFRYHLARKEGAPVSEWPPPDTSEGWCETCLMYE
ncbi:hypothetical protein DRW03_04185 [Corallococcus sp. H22C18031201]|nr:hypothetical protein DRW03_04185 [Corallococcus sp. H22C18031201]